MTREEIDKIASDYLNDCESESDMLDVFEVAKEALEQEPCEDVISRQAVMDCFKKWQPYMATRLWDFEQELSALQSVTSQPKTGHWINAYPDIEPNPMFMYAICSVCNFKQSISIKLNFCPNCGLKMIEPQERSKKE